MKTYYMLTKPGIVLGNVVTTASGFFLASKGHFDIKLFLITLLGLGLVIASAGVFNCYLDRKSDAKMHRTKNRPLANGTISIPNALVFGTILGVLGFGVLATYVNVLTATVAMAGFLIYLFLYGISKYHTFYGTLIGSLAGGIPPVVGYVAVSHQLDLGAFILFMILVMWQMPHFFAISIYQLDDYQAAEIPVLPVVRGIPTTKIHIIFYVIAFIFTVAMLSIMNYTGWLYSLIAVSLGLGWLGLSLYGLKNNTHDKQWARQMFIYSLVVIMGICITIPLEKF